LISIKLIVQVKDELKPDFNIGKQHSFSDCQSGNLEVITTSLPYGYTVGKYMMMMMMMMMMIT